MRRTKFSYQFLFGIGMCLISLLFLGSAKAKKERQSLFTESVMERLEWRCVGPANMGGRIDDCAVVEENPHIIYIGTASGGAWKSTNNGVTWKPIFDNQSTSSIGDITVSPSNRDIVWIGTGEPNSRQSSSWGDGVFKSLDGGQTWRNMGLRDTHHIGRIVIHPQNPDIVYVAALGHLWGPNKERGLFKTVDGGKTWGKSLYINENTGCVDVAIDLKSPNTLYAAAYQRRRRGWGFNGGGPGSGLYKTTDGGESWMKLSNGLPSGIIGRIGITIYRNNSNIVYCILEHKQGGVFRSEDKGMTWKKMSSTNPRPMYYSKIHVDPNNDLRIWVLGGAMFISEDGGKTFKAETFRDRRSLRRIHGDFHAMWINPLNSNHMIVGSDGGIYFSYDHGHTWDFVNSLPIGQFYEVGFDMRNPYYVYGGLQDNDCWGGPSATRHSLGITNEDWFKIGGGDGFSVQVDPTDHTTVYAVFQRGNLFRFDLKSGQKKSIRPQPQDEKEIHRFNWNSPILISPHNSNTIYFGGNRLFTSLDRGETWDASVDLTTQQDQDSLPLMGVLSDEETLSKNDGITFYGDITTISESPLKKGLLYVGTDDGNLQVSQDGGKTWKNVINNVPGVPKHTYVSRVVFSHFEKGRAYVTFDGHRNDDFKPYVFVTEDYGESWKSISSNLPDGGTVNVIREHPRNPNLLFVGTERGAYISINRGENWVKMKGNLPIVPVDDIAIHPRENDLIFGTHGRGIWILDDITPLEQLTEDVLASKSHLFDICETTIFTPYDHKSTIGHRIFVAPNPPYGVVVNYYLEEKVKENVKIIIKDNDGKVIRKLEGLEEAGINRTTWNLRYAPPPQAVSGEYGRYFRTQAPKVLPGEYTVTLKISDFKMTKSVKIVGDQQFAISFEDRKAQHDVLYTLYELYPVLHSAEETLASLDKKITQTEKTLKEIPNISKLLQKELETISQRIVDIRLELLGNPKLGWPGVSSSVRGKLVLLGRAIEGYTGPPSQQQTRQIQINSEKLEKVVIRINQVIEENIPKLNKMMTENNIGIRISEKKIKISRKPGSTD